MPEEVSGRLQQVQHIRGLDFIGFMASGSYYQAHHFAIAKGDLFARNKSLASKAHKRGKMADEEDFAKELNALIRRYIDGGSDPQDIADELLREANSVFGHYNLEIYLAAKPAAGR